MGLLIQMLSTRLGSTGRHLVELCCDEYPDWAKIVLWFMAEVALIGADIQEVIGSAIAIQILSRGFLPLWASVLLTAVDCFIFLLLENYGVRKLEVVLAVLITTMGLSFAWIFADAKPSRKELVIGLLVPRLSSRTIRLAGSLNLGAKVKRRPQKSKWKWECERQKHHQLEIRLVKTRNDQRGGAVKKCDEQEQPLTENGEDQTKSLLSYVDGEKTFHSNPSCVDGEKSFHRPTSTNLCHLRTLTQQPIR